MFESLFGKTWEPERDIPSLQGKVILVTGGELRHLLSSTGDEN